MNDSDAPPPAAQAAPEQADAHLVYRAVAGQVECALWTLAAGDRALALFASAVAAEAFVAAAGLSDEWRTTRAVPNDLVSILRHCRAAGIRYVVIDPDQERAKRLFEIAHVLAAIDTGPPDVRMVPPTGTDH